ncbi:MAG: helix-turn-helix domain-containing protein [Bdellovibrionales bacterium]|nr:helix-turn-helix domain-containing protein [Bdellovibrionales bacterium]
MKKDPTLGKHSHNNRESKEGQVLRFIREARKLSLIDVAGKLSMKSMEVDHFENGRKFYTVADIEKFLECYAVKKVDFENLMRLKIINRQIVNHFLSTL